MDHTLKAYTRTYCRNLVNGAADSDNSSATKDADKRKRVITVKTDENGEPLVKKKPGPKPGTKRKPLQNANIQQEVGHDNGNMENEIPVNIKFKRNDTVVMAGRKGKLMASKSAIMTLQHFIDTFPFQLQEIRKLIRHLQATL